MSGSESGSDLENTVGLINAVSPIAAPLAGKKLQKRLFKLVKKSCKAKAIKRGVKETVKALRKGKASGVVVLAGDISPIDVLSHVPVLCEESNIPYVFVRSRSELGAAALSKRATCCLLVQNPQKNDDKKIRELFKSCIAEVSALGSLQSS
jgi:H/ACA ribonucleoprotein complex subunit 2